MAHDLEPLDPIDSKLASQWVFGMYKLTAAAFESTADIIHAANPSMGHDKCS